MAHFQRPLVIWLGSYLAAVPFLMIYWHVPLLPVILGGVLTLSITIVRLWMAKK